MVGRLPLLNTSRHFLCAQSHTLLVVLTRRHKGIVCMQTDLERCGMQQPGMPRHDGLSVGEVWSVPVLGHFCQTGDWTVRSLTKFWDQDQDCHRLSISVWSRSRPGPDPVPACSVPLGLLWQPTGGHWCAGCIVMSQRMSAWCRYSQGTLRSTWGMGEANGEP